MSGCTERSRLSDEPFVGLKLIDGHLPGGDKLLSDEPFVGLKLFGAGRARRFAPFRRTLCGVEAGSV